LNILPTSPLFCAPAAAGFPAVGVVAFDFVSAVFCD